MSTFSRFLSFAFPSTHQLSWLWSLRNYQTISLFFFGARALLSGAQRERAMPGFGWSKQSKWNVPHWSDVSIGEPPIFLFCVEEPLAFSRVSDPLMNDFGMPSNCLCFGQWRWLKGYTCIRVLLSRLIGAPEGLESAQFIKDESNIYRQKQKEQQHDLFFPLL